MTQASMPVAQREPQPFDAVTFLTIYLVLLLAIPSGLRIPALGSAGSPALLWAIGGAVWWLAERLRARRPVLWDLGLVPSVAVAFAMATAVSYVFAVLRTAPAIEGNTAQMGLLRVASWVGVLLVASDGIATRRRLLVLLRRLALAGGLMGFLGLLQFATGQSLIGWITIPGMATDAAFIVPSRDGFTRAAGTTVHPLELAVVVTMALPVGVALALHDRSRGWLARWFPLAAISGALAVSVSRSALIGLAAALLVVGVAWPRRTQLRGLLVVLCAGVAVYLLVPGMGSTMLSLFAGIGTDASSQSRTGTYGLALWVAGQSPWFGRGLGTFVPGYVILDNQLLLLLLEVGIVGLAAFLALVGAGTYAAWAGRRASSSLLDRDLGQGLLASIVAGTLLLVFFDGLSFTMVGGLLFLVLGLAGAYHRLHAVAVPRWPVASAAAQSPTGRSAPDAAAAVRIRPAWLRAMSARPVRRSRSRP